MAIDLLWPAALAAIGGIAMLRWSWGRTHRSALANGLGWGALLLAMIGGGVQAGAWGIAIVSLVGMTAAIVWLGWAAAMSPRGDARASARRVRMVPEAGEPRRIMKRFTTFILVVIGGFAASVALGIAIRAATLGTAWVEADANAAALIAVPLIWGILAAGILMLERRRSQLIVLVATGLPLIPALILGS